MSSVVRFEGIVEQVNSRWTVGLSIAWHTMLIGASAGILLTYG